MGGAVVTYLDARNIAHVLGGDAIGRDAVSAPGPGHSRTDRSLSLKLVSGAPEGFLVFDHAGGDHLRYRDYARERLGLPPRERGKSTRRATSRPVVDPGPDPEKEKKKAWALKIWSESTDPAGTIVEHYLREHRGLELSGDIAGAVIRFHAGLKFDDRYVPGMVCLMRDIVTDEPCGIHRTFLDRRTGQKIDRKMLGVAKGAAIKLDAHSTISTKLTIGEGVETVLAARMMGLVPVWSLASSGAVARFPVLKNLTEISILEENDARSRQDVETCGRRYFQAGTPVKVITPSVGKDMNDVLRAAQ
jgi:putative DNA primase/helicase